jgi:membrane protein YdbS with pleckstrin-like domain
MGYPAKLLNPGEQVAVDVGPHWKFLAGPVLAVALTIAGAVVALQAGVPRWAELALAGAIVVCLLWLVARYLHWATTSFVVTNERLIVRKGVVRRSWHEILLDRLTDISCRQTLSDRLLGCGDIMLESAGRDSQEVFKNLPRPHRIQSEIYRLVNQRRTVVPGPGIAASGSNWQPGPVAPSTVAGTLAGPPGGTAAAEAFAATGRFATSEAPTGSIPEPTVADQLSQLDELRRRRVISRREFAAKKAELLARM